MSLTIGDRSAKFVQCKAYTMSEINFQPLYKKWYWLLLFFYWTLFGIFFAAQSCLSQAYIGKPVNWQTTLASWLTCSYIWGIFSIPIIGWAKRFSFEQGQWRKSLLIHLTTSILVTLVQLCSYILVYGLITSSLHDAVSATYWFKNLVIAEFHAGFLTYWSIVGISQTIDYYRNLQEKELKASQLQTQLTQAHLDALKMQLQPHFLFNTLNTISVLMQEDVKAANDVLVCLSNLLRISLKNVGLHEVPLKQELEFLESYLQIEQTRFQDRLSVRMCIEPQTLAAQVPNLILQPLVENAIRHGIAPHTAAGEIEIRAEKHDSMVRLQITDNGSGMAMDKEQHTSFGIGLTNTQTRLTKLYGDAHSFHLDNIVGGGLSVTITLPLRLQPSLVSTNG